MRIDDFLVTRAWERRNGRRRTGTVGNAPRPDLPIGVDALPQIKHIVVLMMENHSYDNYFATLGRGDGLRLKDGKYQAAVNPALDGTPVYSKRFSSSTQYQGSPSQSWHESHLQWAEGTQQGFASSAQRQKPVEDPSVGMDYWTKEDLPFYHDLATTFPVADRWFSSCMGPTFPNRRFLIAGTAHGLTTDDLAQTFDSAENGTLFDLLGAHGISWCNYHSASHIPNVAARMGGMAALSKARRTTSLLQSTARLVGKANSEVKSIPQFTADTYPLGLLHYLGHVRSIERFLVDAANGTLPSVTLVDPDYRSNSEENPQDIHAGEAFSAKIINAVMHGPNWPSTVLIWVYDEHGGYYDHVAPPKAVPPDDVSPREGGPWGYDRYGFRVPAVIISPFAKPHYVSHVIHDHTSILKLIETKWNLPPLTFRDAAADDLLDSLDLTAPPTFLKPPALELPHDWR